MINCYKDKISQLKDPKYAPVFTQIQRGIEREALRMNDDAELSDKPHSTRLGSALTHTSITTDYAESLLEFITPVHKDIDELVDYLSDLHRFTLDNIDDELLWPMSMPCMVAKEDDIELANYGSSNVGQMKHIYRKGLKNRYGSLMQVISGLHFNYSLGDDAWPVLQEFFNESNDITDFRSTRYFSLIRNFHRLGWVVPYMFGASPALCGSFIKNDMPYDFKKLGKGTYFLPHGTSLRLSDLGYTNSEQDNLSICYNDIENYVSSVNSAIATPSENFEKIGIKENGSFNQLNTNVLQIENELYAPIRPKRVAKSGQKPSEALKEGGVEYIEVRSLDVNPFVNVGIDKTQIRFLDMFLMHCMLWQDKPMNQMQRQQKVTNLNNVILNGRQPGLMLEEDDGEISLQDWMARLFDALGSIALLFDHHNGGTSYQECLDELRPMVNNPDATYSGKLMAILQGNNIDNTPFGVAQAKKFREEFSESEYSVLSQAALQEKALKSLAEQQAIEDADTVSIDEYLAQYFEK